MTTQMTTNPMKSIFLATIAIMVAFCGLSCMTKNEFLVSSVVPAARGHVDVKKDKNDNYGIQVHVFSLSEVERLQPAKQSYVVWMETDNQTTKNLGQISSSSGALSKNLKASFETVSPTKPNKIFITAENDPGADYPGTVILSTARF